MNILITGGSGFLGKQLALQLRKATPANVIFSLSLAGSAQPGITNVECDMTDPEALKRAIESIDPDQIFHLAGGARVSADIGMPEYFANNFLTTTNLILALEKRGKPASLFFSSTVHVYGNQTVTVDETHDPAPVSAYGFTKLLAEEALRQAVDKMPYLRVVVGRLYSCIGPGQSTGFVVSDLVGKLAKLRPGETLQTGPLNGVRRFVDVRDAVAIFLELLEKAPSRFEIYNLASPHELSIEALVAMLLAVSGKKVPVKSRADSSKNPFRGLAVRVEKLNATLSPNTNRFRPLEETLRDMWRHAQRSA